MGPPLPRKPLPGCRRQVYAPGKLRPLIPPPKAWSQDSPAHLDLPSLPTPSPRPQQDPQDLFTGRGGLGHTHHKACHYSVSSLRPGVSLLGLVISYISLTHASSTDFFHICWMCARRRAAPWLKSKWPENSEDQKKIPGHSGDSPALVGLEHRGRGRRAGWWCVLLSNPDSWLAAWCPKDHRPPFWRP